MLNSQQYLCTVRSESGSVGRGQSRCCDRKLLTWSRCKDKRPPPTLLQNMDDYRQRRQRPTGSLLKKAQRRNTFIFKTNKNKLRFWFVPVLSLSSSNYTQAIMTNFYSRSQISGIYTEYSWVQMRFSICSNNSSTHQQRQQFNIRPLVFNVMKCNKVTRQKQPMSHYVDNCAFFLISRHEYYSESSTLKRTKKYWEI